MKVKSYLPQKTLKIKNRFSSPHVYSYINQLYKKMINKNDIRGSLTIILESYLIIKIKLVANIKT